MCAYTSHPYDWPKINSKYVLFDISATDLPFYYISILITNKFENIKFKQKKYNFIKFRAFQNR
jgi:hypothetical protein